MFDLNLLWGIIGIPVVGGIIYYELKKGDEIINRNNVPIANAEVYDAPVGEVTNDHGYGDEIPTATRIGGKTKRKKNRNRKSKRR